MTRVVLALALVLVTACSADATDRRDAAALRADGPICESVVVLRCDVVTAHHAACAEGEALADCMGEPVETDGSCDVPQPDCRYLEDAPHGEPRWCCAMDGVP